VAARALVRTDSFNVAHMTSSLDSSSLRSPTWIGTDRIAVMGR
jgi:hypothetical protein